MGTIYVDGSTGKEVFSFEYDSGWLEKNKTIIPLDPELKPYAGRQYVNGQNNMFGVFTDSCPDRWGRLLIQKKENIQAKKEERRARKLRDIDFLLGVYDETRMGALRYCINEGEFLSSDKEIAAPPWTSLRELEEASRKIEEEDRMIEKWLQQLLAPGSSLGGARPKASVVAPDGSLWIAKFPSKHDEVNVGAWEMVVHDLALMCNINVPEAKLEKFSKTGSTFLTKRFDRNGSERIQFESAMTLLGKRDGDDASTGVSYLDIASFIARNSASAKDDLNELWKRIVFSVAVSNTDDHLRNHGFILHKEGWRLSPAYDINPNFYGEGLALNIDETDNSLSFSLCEEVASVFRVDDPDDYIGHVIDTVENNWRKLANKYELGRAKQEIMTPAFDMSLK
jgi:serine/threonine-protein kinase HipA